MRRIRHLDHCDYIAQVKPKGSQPLLMSGQSNCLVERTWHRDADQNFQVSAHAKFNADAMNGIQIMAFLDNNGRIVNSTSGSVTLSRVLEDGWTESIIGTFATTLTGRVHSLYVDAATLLPNELSGMETYAADIVLQRVRISVRKKIWFNHLGVYDNILGTRRDIDRLIITKADS